MTQPVKWATQLRTLPLSPASQDFLKLEYIDVNLSNLRKLISNLDKLTELTQELIKQGDTNNGSFMQLERVKAELDWI